MTPPDEPQIERRIAHDYFCRFHMSVILAAVIASGVLASKCLLELGVSLRFRYPLAVLLSYVVFLLLIRVWIWYVWLRGGGRAKSGNPGFDWGGGSGSSGSSFSFGGSRSGGSGTSGGFSGYGGGDSGGGGATSSWEGNEAAAVVATPSSGSSGAHWWSGKLGGSGGSGDDNGWLVVLLLAALVACILGGGIYLVVAAPHILPEAAAQVLLAGTLTRVSKEHHHNWMLGVLGSTWIPFVIVLSLAGALGWEAHRYCPSAPRLIDLLSCPGK